MTTRDKITPFTGVKTMPRKAKMRSFLVIWQPLAVASTVDEMRVIDAFASTMTLAQARDQMEKDAAKGEFSAAGEGIITMVEKADDNYRILGPEHFGGSKVDDDGSDQIVANVNGQDVTRGDLRKAFDRVQPKDNWKNPIDCVVTLTGEEIAMVEEAVAFFTGSVAHIEPSGAYPDLYRVTAAGYYRTIGA